MAEEEGGRHTRHQNRQRENESPADESVEVESVVLVVASRCACVDHSVGFSVLLVGRRTCHPILRLPDDGDGDDGNDDGDEETCLRKSASR